ncbi:hypothetical protein Q1695_006673 [Nippostrongylus brasiliensis]|nr:hypothetical protein Q1695_006673 [Nippostrongylus brasiliensis]
MIDFCFPGFGTHTVRGESAIIPNQLLGRAKPTDSIASFTTTDMFNSILNLVVAQTMLVSATPTTNSYFWKQRELKCVHYDSSGTRCSLIEPGLSVEQNPGCFDEPDSKNVTRVYCGLNCPESDETTIVTKTPRWNHICSMFYTYNLERRRKDWYLWRSEACLNETITFEVSCGTHRDPRIFYLNNEHLFEYEDAE